MNDRLVTAFGALLALLFLAALMFQGGGPPPSTRPTTVETGRNGYAAMARWLEGEGVSVVSLRERLEALQEGNLGLPASGNLLITTMPHRHRLRHEESQTLWRWIGDGNTVLIMAALDDTPDWSQEVSTTFFLEDLQRVTGLEFAAPTDEDQRRRIGKALTTTTVTLDGIAAHPLMNAVNTLAGESDSLAVVWEVRLEEDGYQAVLKLARESESGVAGLWELRFGRGHVIVSALGSLLTNRVIGDADNATFVANLLAYHVAPGGAVIFDDMHQGLTTLYDPEAFFGDPRLGATLLFVLGFWALYLLGANSRLMPLRRNARAPSQGAFVAGVGGFLARKLSRVDTGRLMVGAWFDDLRHRGSIPQRGSPWQALSGLPMLDAGRLARLRVYHDALERGDDVDLKDLHNTIEELRRMLR